MRLRYVNLWEALFPSHFRSSVWRRVSGVIGMTMLFAAFGLGLALASWSSLDPSLNHATAAPVGNWLGKPGAVLADLLMQTFGLGAIAVVLVLAGWGWRMTAGSSLARPGRRILSTLLATLLIGGFASSLSPPETWPLTAGLGGIAGDGMAAVLAWPLGLFGSTVGPEAEAIFAAVVALGAVILLIYAGGLAGLRLPPAKRGRRATGNGDLQDEAPASIIDALRLGAGALIHFAWSLYAISRRLVRWAWRMLHGGTKIDPKSRLKLAMERADHDDIAWSDPTDLYAPTPVSTDGIAGDDRDDEFADARETEPRRAGPIAYLRDLLRMQDEAPEPAHSRAEPALFDAGFTPDFQEDDDALLHAEAALEEPEAAPRKPRKRRAKPVGDDYCLPPLTLLNEAPPRNARDQMSAETLMENARLLEGVLDDFGVRGEIINVRPGPVVTLYELEPAPGLKSSRVIGLADDIARSMSAVSARVAVVPGRNAIGIELPNEKRETVFLREIFASETFTNAKHKLALTLGKNIGGEPIVADLARMPHLLIAGTTGSGKSVGINTMILSMLFRMTPDECKMIMIDPKMLELSVYDGIPHLLTPVVTDPKKAVVALKWTVREMEERYKNMSKLGVRNIDGFNKRVAEANAKGEALSRTVQTGFDAETGQPIYETEDMQLEPMPYIVVVVDEMADLMMVAGKDIEGAIQRLAQMARAAGIHIVMATQRPSVDVITGTIKANFPTRISFQVTSKIDSRTILGEQGAEQLLGQGDMLYMAGGGRISRVHGAFVSDEEVEAAVQFLKRQGVPQYLDAVTEEPADGGEGGDAIGGTGDGGGSDSNSLYDQAVAIVARDRKASTSYIQRRLQIGYNRAATIIERMEQEGVVGAANHAGKREVLVPEPSFED